MLSDYFARRYRRLSMPRGWIYGTFAFVSDCPGETDRYYTHEEEQDASLIKVLQ